MFGDSNGQIKLRAKQKIKFISATSVPSALVDTPSLFSNIDPACKPITTKFKRCGEDNRLFIQTEIEKMIKEVVIEDSTSPWRVQVLIVTNERQRKRLAVDYSKTINGFTRLDAYPLPRMEDLAQEIAKYKIYSSLELKNAYHQIPIKEEDKPMRHLKLMVNFTNFVEFLLELLMVLCVSKG